MQEKNGKYMFGVFKVNEKGQIVIPKQAREIYDIKPGENLLLMGDKVGLALVKTEVFTAVADEILDI